MKLPQRIESKFIRGEPDQCWPWIAANRNGYGVLRWEGRLQGAHRVVRELFYGPIPEGLVPDHLCRNPACVNPDHIEPVPFDVNVRRGVGASAINSRKTHCPAGHEYAGKNMRIVYVDGRPRRQCRPCDLARQMRYYWVRKNA